MPESKPSSTSSRAWEVFRRCSWWRWLVTTVSWGAWVLTWAMIVDFRRSRFWWVCAEIATDIFVESAPSKAKSTLFLTQITRFPAGSAAAKIPTSFLVSSLSNSISTTSACSMARRERSMPSDSTTSWVSRMPAVSMKRNFTPSSTMVSSITSRVVPAISVTMARSSLSKALSKVDLPTLGEPMMATGRPSLRAFP